MAQNKADVSEAVNVSPAQSGEREKIPLSALNQFLFCPRRVVLIHVEDIFKDNAHTVIGTLGHEHADLPGYESQISNLKFQIILLRALPVFSERLGLSGKCDMVEVEMAAPISNLKFEISNRATLRPVEYKKGKRRRFENDDAQLCAQALCLEEMFGVTVEGGAIFHAASKHRREVVFTPELRRRTENAIVELRRLLDSRRTPPAVCKEACEECSLYEVCLPKITSHPESLRQSAENLFQT